jgi:hypothetical protein
MKVGALCLVLVGLSSADPALAASDEVLRAVYCAAVLDDTIDQLHQANADAARETSEPSRSAILEGNARLLQQLTANRDRLKAYATTGIVSNDQSEALQLAGAKQRGETDSRQCAAESSPKAMQCTFDCSMPTCTGADANCLEHCDEQCGMATCARTLPCLDPTWLHD